MISHLCLFRQGIARAVLCYSGNFKCSLLPLID
jgi:hypothetical protein